MRPHWWLLLCRRRGCWAPIPSPLPFLRANSPICGRLCHHYGGKRKTGDPAAENQQAPYGWVQTKEGNPVPILRTQTGGAMLPWEATGNMEATKGLCWEVSWIFYPAFYLVPTLGPGCRHFPLMCRCRSLCRAKA